MIARRIVLISALAWLVAQPGAAPLAQQPGFRARVDAVTVTVSVMKGRDPVAGLTAADFDLTDNGVKQRVEAASLETVPIDVTLATTGGSMRNESGLIEGVVQANRLRQVLRAGDRLRRVSIGDRVRGGIVPADQPFYPGDKPPKPVPIPGISLIDGLFYVLAWPVEADRRHLAIVFTEGLGRYSTLEPNRLLDLASRSDAVLHVAVWASPNDSNARSEPGPPTAISEGLKELVGPPVSPTNNSDWRETYNALDQSARRTGGSVRRVTDSVKAFQEILADFRSSYLLQYTPAGVPSAGWHEIKVKLLRPGSFTIRARRGYQGD